MGTNDLFLLACLLFQMLTQLQTEMDGATQLVDSIVLEKGINVGASTKVKMRRASLKAKIRLEVAMSPVKASGLAAGSPNSPLTATANQLLSDLERFCDLEDEISQVTALQP